MSDFRLKVVAETQAAERSLQQVDKVATEATKPRQINVEIPNYSDISKNFRDLGKDVTAATNNIKTFYNVASKFPVGPISELNEMAGQFKRVATTATESTKTLGDAGGVIQAVFSNTNKAADVLVSKLTRIALSMYILNEAASAVSSAFGGLFNETIGREVKLRETILKTQTTLASTNKVFRDGKEITDPYQKIVTLTGAVRKNIDSIRERSIALAGVTSNEVIEVFGIVAGQIGQIGGGLKEAEDLAINFAAALGTFGIPLYQARQEIGSILRGDITMDSYLAKALGITNEDIARAKTETGGVVKFLEERLAAAVAGQRIAAEGFSGVLSNIKDLRELIGQNFGAGLLDPLIGGLTTIFNFLFKIKEEMFSIAKLAGTSIGATLSTAVGLISGASGGARQTAGGGGGSGSRGTVDNRTKPQVISDTKAADVLKGIESGIKRVQLEINKAISTVYLQLATLSERIVNAFGAITKGLAGLALGLLSLKLEQLKAVIGAIESLSPALLLAAKGVGNFLGLWGKFLELPLVQEITQISAGMRALQVTGVMPLISAGFILKGVIENWGKAIGIVQTQFNALRAIIGGVIAWIGQLIAQAGRAGVALLTAWQPAGKALQALRTELLATVSQLEAIGTTAQRTGQKLGGLDGEVKKVGGGLVTVIAGMIKFQLLMFAISAGLSIIIERFSAWKEAQDKIANDKRVAASVKLLATTYKDLGDNATEAQKRAKAFHENIVNQRYDEALQNLEKVRKKLEELRDLSDENIGNWLQRVLQAMNLANIDVKPKEGESFADAVYRTRLANEKIAQDEVAKYGKEVNRLADQENIRIAAQNRTNLENEIKELRRSHESELFQQRQTLAQKEVEIFQAAGELRIRQMERANAKLIEGEEGASRVALEALNTYLVTKEQGEIEIESAKRTLIIETNNLEKAIADYRFETEKKIAEIRKRSADNEKTAADAAAKAAGSSGGGGGGAATFGSTGNVKNAPGWVHGHFQTNTGTRDELITDVLPVLKELLAKGIPVELSSGARIAGGKTDTYYREMLKRAAQQHGHSGDGRSIDLFVPEGTKVPVPLTDISGNKGRAGVTGGLPGSGKSWVGHLTPTSKAGGAAPRTSSTAATPTAPADSAVGAVDPKQYETAVRGVLGAMARLRQLQEALINAKTVEAFENIAKSVFQPVELEQYQDQLYEVQLTYDAVAASSTDAFNPERAKIAVEQATKIAASNRELGQIIEGINARSNISENKKKTLIEQVTARQKAFVASLKDEELARYRIQAVSNVTQVLQQIKQQTAAIYDQIEADKLRNRLEAEGESPERVSAELAKLALRKELNKAQEELTDLLEKEKTKRDEIAALLPGAKDAERTRIQAELDAALARIKELEQKQTDLPKAGAAAAAAIDAQAVPKTPAEIVQDRIGQLKREAAELTNVGNMTVKVADSIGSAFSNSFKGIINGSMTARQALGSFFQNVADMFLEMAAQMIAKMIMLAFLNSIVGILPGAGGGGGALLGFGGAGDPLGAGGAFWNAKGNAFAQNGIQPFAQGGIVNRPTLFKFAQGGSLATGVMGEAGPEAILPLSRGPGGKLGVSGGGGNITVNVSVDASGSKVQGDSGKGEQLGRAVSQAVQEELLRQKRPGGLLAG